MKVREADIESVRVARSIELFFGAFRILFIGSCNAHIHRPTLMHKGKWRYTCKVYSICNTLSASVQK